MATNNLKKILTEEGLSQSRLAVKAEVSLGTVNKICSQKRQCSPMTNHKILKGLNNITEKSYVYETLFPNSNKY